MENRIDVLKSEIEYIQNEWEEDEYYDGCLAKNVRGMIDALDIITEKTWKFDKNGKLVSC